MKLVYTAKFLGMLFNSSLHWKEHIDHIIKRTQPSINLLKMLTGQRWGATKTTQLKIYRSLIKAKLNCAAELQHSATFTELNKLDSIQY